MIKTNEKETINEGQAHSNVSTNLAFRDNKKSVKQLARDLWINSRLKYNESDALKEYEAFSATEFQSLYNNELSKLNAFDKAKDEWTKRGIEIVLKVLTPIDIDNEPYELTHTFKDPLGFATPTVKEILTEYFLPSCESLAVSDPKLYAKQLIDKFSGKEIERTFGGGSRRTTVHIRLICSRYPIEKV